MIAEGGLAALWLAAALSELVSAIAVMGFTLVTPQVQVKTKLPLSGKDDELAGNTSTPGASVASRLLSLLGVMLARGLGWMFPSKTFSSFD